MNELFDMEDVGGIAHYDSLRAEVAGLRAKVRFYELGWEQKELQAEIARLREALEDTRDLSNNPGPVTALARLSDINKIARKALAK